MPLANLDLIRLLAILHGDPDPAGPSGSALPQWTTLVHGLLATVGHIRLAGIDYIAFPGSKTGLDWYQDVEAIPVEMLKLGKVHAGFIAAALLVKAQLDKLCGPRVVVFGHSLGAAHAEDYAALRRAEGLPVEEVVVFGSPMPGCQTMYDLLYPIPMRNYRNGEDIVPLVPHPVPLIFPCIQMRAFTQLEGQPDVGDTSPFKWHHTRQYWLGLRRLSQSISAKSV